MFSTVAAAMARALPTANWVQVSGRKAPRETISSSTGMSGTWVNEATCSARARYSAAVKSPAARSTERDRSRLRPCQEKTTATDLRVFIGRSVPWLQ